jgi:feruloyl esterase
MDFGYRAVHETVVTAKDIIFMCYCCPAAFSYFVGCSTGRRQGLMKAQRYPKDFNGIIAGSLVYNYLSQQMLASW